MRTDTKQTFVFFLSIKSETEDLLLLLPALLGLNTIL